MRTGRLPSHFILYDGLIPEDFPKRLDTFKETTELSWDSLAACLGVDTRQLQRWRKGTKPSGDGLFALLLLAARVPGGVHTLLGVHVLPPVVINDAARDAGFTASCDDR